MSISLALLLSFVYASRAFHVSPAALAPHRTRTARTAADEAYSHFDAWARQRTLREVLPPMDLARAVRSMRADKALLDSYRPIYDKATARIEKTLREETRTIREIIGEEASMRALASLEGIAGDPEATRAVLRTPAVESVIGSILYEGIFEFIQTVDLIGNIVNSLPIIGPIRQQIVSGFKRELDRTLGRQVKSFLGSYSRLATEQLASLVLSEENSKGFAQARRRLGEEVLGRPLSSLVPASAVVQDLRESAWALAETPLPVDDEEIIDRVYSLFGDQTIEELGLETPSQISSLGASVLEKFLSSEEGKSFAVEIVG